MKLSIRYRFLSILVMFSLTQVGDIVADSNRVLAALNDLIDRAAFQKSSLSAEEAGALGSLLAVKAAHDIRLSAYQGQVPLLVSLDDPVYLVLLDELWRLFQENITQGMSPATIVDTVAQVINSNNAALVQAAVDAMSIASQIAATAQGASAQQISILQQQIQQLQQANAALQQQVTSATVSKASLAPESETVRADKKARSVTSGMN